MGKGGSVSVKEGNVMSEDASGNPGAVAWPDDFTASVMVRRMQAKLHRWAGEDPSRRFGDLFNLVYDPAFLVHAWERVATDLMKRKALLGSVLQHATPLRVEDGVLTLALQASGFHREMLNDRGNKELINEAVQRHVASARRFELDPNGVAPAGGGGARNHPAVQAALSAFQGEVVAVRPRTPEEGESR